ncbi:Alpha/Beta hydrolase protein [Phakopsora pachyrhizi]|uniref:Alpha/Beta hydrolase protein n=1 Tax=Phakopsora pachyrhizi TaxID=170000 RepID=A0AAV0AK20_PHAPC|nr:Alpha/Beta hydrolase protein [Phakopsora pachyrhizi]
MKYRTQQERRSAKTVLDRLPGSLGHFSVPYQRLKLPVGFSDVNSVCSLLIAFGSRAFSLTTNLLKNQEHIGQPKFPCVEQNHACSVNLMRLRDRSHSSAQNEVLGVYDIGTAKDNVILLHIALSASSHAKSHDLNKSFGWWEKFIGHGPNYPIDLNWYFVICTNVLGSCYGSTGPSSINPETNEPMGPISQSSQSLTRVGSSMGGMQSIVTAWLEPQRVQRVLSIGGYWKNRSIKYCFTICSMFRKNLSTPSFSNLQHIQKRFSSLLSWTAEPVSNLIKLKPINDSNNVQNQCLRFNARRPLKENRRSGKSLMEEVDQEHCISLNED